MRPGARGGWINGSLSWGALDSWQLRSGDYRADHLALARELAAVYRVRTGTSYYYGYSGADKTLDIGDCESPQLWSLLEEAGRVGLKLVHAREELGEVPRHRHGELILDVTRPDDSSALLSTAVRLDGEDDVRLEPLLFIGGNGHGVVCAERSEVLAGHDIDRLRLRLVRLARPAPARLQRMVLDEEHLRIPVGELDRFAQELCPALRGVATICSSDGSFTPPEISAPELVLRARYGAGHALEVAWEWAYRIGEATRHAPLIANGSDPGFRDPEAERAILADARLAETGLERFGLVDAEGGPTATHTPLVGIDSMRFTTEALPRLAELLDMAVEIDGEPADYRDVGDWSHSDLPRVRHNAPLRRALCRLAGNLPTTTPGAPALFRPVRAVRLTLARFPPRPSANCPAPASYASWSVERAGARASWRVLPVSRRLRPVSISAGCSRPTSWRSRYKAAIAPTDWLAPRSRRRSRPYNASRRDCRSDRCMLRAAHMHSATLASATTTWPVAWRSSLWMR